MVAKCFEFDWQYNKLQKFIKNDNEKEKIKNYIKNNY